MLNQHDEHDRYQYFRNSVKNATWAVKTDWERLSDDDKRRAWPILAAAFERWQRMVADMGAEVGETL